jgi:hypothetical protein
MDRWVNEVVACKSYYRSILESNIDISSHFPPQLAAAACCSQRHASTSSAIGISLRQLPSLCVSAMVDPRATVSQFTHGIRLGLASSRSRSARHAANAANADDDAAPSPPLLVIVVVLARRLRASIANPEQCMQSSVVATCESTAVIRPTNPPLSCSAIIGDPAFEQTCKGQGAKGQHAAGFNDNGYHHLICWPH